jgi:dihydrofolate reductase
VAWSNTRLVGGDAAAEVSRLKVQAGKDLVIYGSGGLVSALSPRGLIDDYRVFVAPLVLGGGVPMFRGLESRVALRLAEVKSFRSGAVLLRYEPK